MSLDILERLDDKDHSKPEHEYKLNRKHGRTNRESHRRELLLLIRRYGEGRGLTHAPTLIAANEIQDYIQSEWNLD